MSYSITNMRDMFFPWQRRLRADYAAASKYVREMPSWSDKQVLAIQLQRLQERWQDSISDVPYYRNLVQQGRAPARIRSWADFQEIPELTREVLQKQPADFVRLSGPPDLTRMTGGSIGTPVRFGVWKNEDQILRRLKLALWSKVSYQPDSRLFLIWGHAHLLGTGWRRWLNHLIRKGKDRLVGYQRVDAYSLSPEYCRTIAKKLIAFRPAGLIGYASALDYFVRFTGEFRTEFHDLQLGFVMPCAEPPPRPDTFSLLKDFFGAPIIQEFGGVDFGQVAMKVAEEPFEVFPDHNILEMVPSDKAFPDSGAALVTTLYQRYVPLFRYRQGDEIRGCIRLENGHVCRFGHLVGRLNDMVQLPGGKSIHSVAFLHCVHQEPLITNAQLAVYDSRIVLRIVTNATLTPEISHRIRHRLGQLAAELTDIEIESTEDLETSIAGKRRWFVDKRANTQKLNAKL